MSSSESNFYRITLKMYEFRPKRSSNSWKFGCPTVRNHRKMPEKGEALNRAGPGRSWPVLAGLGRSWPVLAGPRLLVFRKKSAPHPQLVSLTEMRTKGRKPLSVLRLKIFEKVFSENYETLFFRGPARTGQDRPGPARTGPIQCLPLFLYTFRVNRHFGYF